MGTNSHINWTGNTWNPWMGCHKVSQGCKNCYMFRDMERYGREPNKVVKTSPATFNAPLKWKEPAKVFTCSWSDFFIEEADEWRDEAWEIIRQTPHLIYQVLTKRPERILDHLPKYGWMRDFSHVWLGVSVENQEQAEKRIPKLLQVNVASGVRFLSMEPLLGPVDLLKCVEPDMGDWDLVNEFDEDGEPVEFVEECELESDWINYGNNLVVNPEYSEWVGWRERRAKSFALGRQIAWVITGGESGARDKIRPANLDWFRSVRDQCDAANIAYHHKQNGGSSKIDGEWGGRLLDGKEHNEFPKVATNEPLLARA